MQPKASAAIVAIAALLFLNESHADEQAEFVRALSSLAGSWAGHLAYRDYRSDKRVEIPHRRTMSLPPDGAYLLAELTFTDPGYQVYSAEITTVSWPTVQQAYASNGSLEVQQFTVTEFLPRSDGWSARLDGKGTDAGAPADIRLLMTVEAERLDFEKQVRSSGDQTFQFRNAVRLTRAAPTENQQPETMPP